METHIINGFDGSISHFAFRHMIFCEQLNWVPHFSNKLEIDEFDSPVTTHIVVKRLGRVLGYVRVIPTTRSYMLSTVFVSLMGGHCAPEHPLIFESSRFAIDPELQLSHRVAVAREMVSALRKLGAEREAIGLVTATDVKLELFLKLIGIKTFRLGRPASIGGVRCVALASAMPNVHEDVLKGVITAQRMGAAVG